MTYFRFSRVVTVFCIGLFLLGLSFSSGQDVPTTLAEKASGQQASEPLKIKVSVDEVRLDVVVLDKKGNPITDLTAADFEVFQDDKRQKITSSVYIDSQADVASRPAAIQSAPNIPLPPATALKREDVRRTMVFVVDDAAMSFDNGYYTKMALRNFIEKQMRPGDMVSILRTDYGNRELNMFLSDKREVLARINAIPSTMSVTTDFLFMIRSAPLGARDALTRALSEFLQRLHENRVNTISYSLGTLKNMPGRKILTLVTPFWTHVSKEEYRDLIYGNSYIRLADEALRAGVVVNSLDIDGLNGGADAEFSSAWSPTGPPSPKFYGDIILNRMDPGVRNPVNLPYSLPDLTGGVSIKNSNFFLDGIGRETESMMRGYYLISYAPPLDTFKTRKKADDLYRRLKIKVKRKGAVVHARDGFFGRLESESDAVAPRHPLIEAVYSPFLEDDINVDMAAGYIKDAEADYLVRSWIHLDAKDITVVEGEDGGNRIGLEAVFLTSDINGEIQDSNHVEFTLSNVNTDWARKHGIRFSLVLPVKKPGPYYVRIAVHDKESKRTGAAYQFLEIPDLKKKGLALSNIFMLTSADDLQWMSSDAKKEIGSGVFFPMFQGEDARSPALRIYKQGDDILTLTILYNADKNALSRSEIETQTILYKDGKEFLRGAPAPITSEQVENSGNIPLLNRFTVGSNMPPGVYLLQIVATDKKNGNKLEGSTTQTMSFTVTE